MILLRRDNMDPEKLFLWPVMISIIGHVVLISVSSVVDLRANVKAEKLFTVEITQRQSTVEPKIDENTAREKTSQQAEEAKQVPMPEGGREDTVSIGASDVKYAAYLAGVKNKIMRIWKYPPGAYEKSEEGVVVIKISIDAKGSLLHVVRMTSSGFVNLDSGTLDVVRAAAPFQPLPPQYKLSRIHIIASFRYRMKD